MILFYQTLVETIENFSSYICFQWNFFFWGGGGQAQSIRKIGTVMIKNQVFFASTFLMPLQGSAKYEPL
jgi:hypothetical protein